MNKPAVKNKIANLEAQISLLKKAVIDEPDFDIDEVNWKKIKPAVKKIRAKFYNFYQINEALKITRSKIWQTRYQEKI